ncbi:hypothetical protein [Bacillus manliponensis]|uniref:hypothetical protein n=1 Tax=Bacillus manliponensis TaxID=574376 RepID=UPI0035119B3A
MKYLGHIIQFVMSLCGFFVFLFFSGTASQGVIQYKENPTVVDYILHAFEVSSYPYIACVFLLWMIAIIVIFFAKKQREEEVS